MLAEPSTDRHSISGILTGSLRVPCGILERFLQDPGEIFRDPRGILPGSLRDPSKVSERPFQDP
eukprot:257539-Pyramimonas_sp.AAC.1